MFSFRPCFFENETGLTQNRYWLQSKGFRILFRIDNFVRYTSGFWMIFCKVISHPRLAFEYPVRPISRNLKMAAVEPLILLMSRDDGPTKIDGSRVQYFFLQLRKVFRKKTFFLCHYHRKKSKFATKTDARPRLETGSHSWFFVLFSGFCRAQLSSVTHIRIFSY